MSMKVAVVHNLPSGGALRVVEAQVRGLAATHEVEVFTLSTAESAFADLSAARAIHRFEFAPGEPLGRPLGMFDPLVKLADLARLDRAYRGIARAIRERACDVALVHPCRFTQAPAVLEHLAVPAVYVCQEPPRALYEPLEAREPATLAGRLRELRHWPLARALTWRLKALDRAACRAARAVVVSSAYIRDAVRRIYGVEAELVPPGVDTARFAPPAERERERYLLSVGALSPLKGFDLIIEALGQVAAALRPPLVLVCDRGSGAHGEELAEQARARAVQLEVQLRLPDDLLVRRYQRARATVYVPVREPFGLVPLESMACGTPVIGVREGGVLETVEDGVTGLTVPRDAAALARAIEALGADPARAEALGAAGRARVLERWTWDASNAHLAALLARVAGASR